MHSHNQTTIQRNNHTHMKTKAIIITSLLAIAVAPQARADLPGSREIALTACPPAVQKTVAEHARGGHVEEVGYIEIGGQALYVAEVDLERDRDLEIHVDASGKLIETREDVGMSDLPEAVRSTIRNMGGRADDLERHVKAGTTTYHAEIDRTGRPDLDVAIAADGKVISQTEETND